MKIYTTSSESQIDLTAKVADRLRRLAQRRKDQHGVNLAYADKYVLRYKRESGKESGNFFGGTNLHAPDFVGSVSEATLFTGGQLEDMGYDWTMDWDAARVRSAEQYDIRKPLETIETNADEHNSNILKKATSKSGRYHYQIAFKQSYSGGLEFRVLKFDGDSDNAYVGEISIMMPWKYCESQDKKLLNIVDKRGNITMDEAVAVFYSAYGPSKPENVKKLVDKSNKYRVAQANFQNRDPEAANFMVPLNGKHKSLSNGIKGRINRALHALGNYHEQIPLDEIFNILKEQKVIVLQEDGTKWSGMVTTQGECGSEKASQGPMKFELAWLPEGMGEYVIANNYLIMTVCTMSSNRLEVIVYVS